VEEDGGKTSMQSVLVLREHVS